RHRQSAINGIPPDSVIASSGMAASLPGYRAASCLIMRSDQRGNVMVTTPRAPPAHPARDSSGTRLAATTGTPVRTDPAAARTSRAVAAESTSSMMNASRPLPASMTARHPAPATAGRSAASTTSPSWSSNVVLPIPSGPTTLTTVAVRRSRWSRPSVAARTSITTTSAPDRVETFLKLHPARNHVHWTHVASYRRTTRPGVIHGLETSDHAARHRGRRRRRSRHWDVCIGRYLAARSWLPVQRLRHGIHAPGSAARGPAGLRRERNGRAAHLYQRPVPGRELVGRDHRRLRLPALAARPVRVPVRAGARTRHRQPQPVRGVSLDLHLALADQRAQPEFAADAAGRWHVD